MARISYNLILDTKYCAISSQRRQLALPIAYKRLFIHVSLCLLNTSHEVYWESNFGLHTTGALQKFVKEIDIYVGYKHADLASVLGLLLDRINKEAGELPEEYGSKLSEELFGNMECELKKIASKYPNATCIQIQLLTAQNMASQLLGVFSPLVKILGLFVEVPFDLEYYPPNLNQLYFWFREQTVFPLPQDQES